MKFILTLIALLTVSAPSEADERERKKELLLDNLSVEVVRLTYPAGTDSGMHTHKYPNRVLYFITGGTLELVPEDEEKPSTILNATEGQTLYLPATTHNVKNIGDTEIVMIETEIKGL